MATSLVSPFKSQLFKFYLKFFNWIKSEKVINSYVKFSRKFLALLLLMVHLIGAYFGMNYLVAKNSEMETFFQTVSLSGEDFFNHLFTIGLFFYFVFLAAWNLGLRPPSYLRSIGGAFCLSIAISVLLAADAEKFGNHTSKSMPENFSTMIYLLITQRQALLVLAILMIVVVGIGGYHLFRTLFSVTYSGSGIQIKLPGQTMYYVPIYPQISWQNTGIKIQSGDHLHIELSGYVSPGGIQQISELQKHMDAFNNWQEMETKNKKKGGISKNTESCRKALNKVLMNPTTWPYTGPEGYPEDWYGPVDKKEILKTHRNYKEDYFFREDECLTVKGLPHNRVLGIIRAKGDPKPKEAKPGSPAYDYEKDKEELIDLSADRYPFTYEAKKSGELWLVINDVDIARWDNSGMFFLKLTRNAWL